MDIVLRCALLFVAAYAINMTLHEGSHALTAYALGVRSTLFHFYTDVDVLHANQRQRAVISCAGPLFSLVFGAIFLLAYEKNQRSPYGLLFFYLAIFGISIFLGNLISISFVGDFSRAAALVGLPSVARYAISITAALLLAIFMFLVGRELGRWTPPGSNRLTAVIALVIAPVVVGTLLIVVTYLPMPSTFVASTMGSSLFWIFAVAGVFLGRFSTAESRRLPPLWADIGIVLAAVAVVRLLVPGIPFVP